MTSRRQDPGLAIAMEGKGAGWAVPVPGKRYAEELRASASLAAAGAYALTVAVDVFKSRWLHLFIAVDAAAAGNKVSIIPEVSMDPEGSAASFFVPSVTDGTVTVGNLGVSPLAEYTVHNFGAVTYVPVEILTPAAVGGTDKLRMSVSLNVEKAYWIRFRVAEDGAVGTPATLALTFSKSV